MEISKAIQDHNLEVLQELINAGQEINEKHYELLEETSNEFVKVMIQAGIRLPNFCYPYLHTPFSDAISSGDLAAIDEYIRSDCGIANARDSHGITTLMLAIRSHRNENVKEQIIAKLFDAGADVNAISDRGGTALEYVLCYIHGPKNSLVKLLLDAEADVNTKYHMGQSILMIAFKTYNIETCRPFAQDNYGMPAIGYCQKIRDELDDGEWGYDTDFDSIGKMLDLVKQAQDAWTHVQDRLMILHAMSNSLL